MVVKHKGADFLKPKAVMSMSWYQEHGYDIVIFLIFLISLISWLMFKLCSCCLRLCCGHKKTKQEWDAIQKYDVPFPKLSKCIDHISLKYVFIRSPQNCIINQRQSNLGTSHKSHHLRGGEKGGTKNQKIGVTSLMDDACIYLQNTVFRLLILVWNSVSV